jgi:hypothetical protein
LFEKNGESIVMLLENKKCCDIALQTLWNGTYNMIWRILDVLNCWHSKWF